MHELQDFISNNLWLCLGLGLVVLVVGDEILGVTRNLIGDEEERLTREAKAKYREIEKQEEEELDLIDEPPKPDGPAIEDLLKPR